jgi:hypothetical protein
MRKPSQAPEESLAVTTMVEAAESTERRLDSATLSSLQEALVRVACPWRSGQAAIGNASRDGEPDRFPS